MTNSRHEQLGSVSTMLTFDLGDTGPYAIAIDSDGSIWVTLVKTGELVRRALDGAEDRFAIGQKPGLLAVGSGAVSCAVSGSDHIAKITPEDQVELFDATGALMGSR